MAFGLSRTRLSPIAIDPGADQLKLVQVAGGDPPQIVAMAGETVPESARGDMDARQAFIEDALPRLVQQGGFRGRRAMCTIPAFNTYVHHLDIANNQKVSQDEQLHSQLRERLNIEPTRMVVRSFELGQVQQESGQVTRLVALAARRDKVMRYVELARKCRLEVVGMHSEPLCVVNAFSHLFRRDTDQQRATCFVDMGAATTKVTIAHGREMRFTKTIQAGGDQMIKALAETRGIGFDQARQAHWAEQPPLDQPLPQNEPTAETADAPPAETSAGSEAATGNGTAHAATLDATSAPADAATETRETIIDELRLCLRYHTRLFSDTPIEQLIFTGGGAHDPAQCRAIAEATGLPARIGDPIAKWTADARAAIVGIDPSVPQPGWAVAAGLTQCDANL